MTFPQLSISSPLKGRTERPQQSGDQALTSPRALMVEENAVAGEHVVGLAEVDGDPVRVQLGSTCKKIPKNVP